MADKQYDRATQDLGNIVNLGHVNVCITDQELATHYYITGLGLTRDPFLNTGAGNMWVNVGVSQFHLPTGQPDVLRGVTASTCMRRTRAALAVSCWACLTSRSTSVPAPRIVLRVSIAR